MTSLQRHLVVLAGILIATPVAAFQLITEAEALLPSAYMEGKRAGVTRGPGVEVTSPADAVKKDAVAFKVNFKPRGGAQIDPGSVRVTYLKNPAVDLTERVRPHVTAQGITIDGAQVPTGQHQLKVEVADTEGRVGSRLVNFTAN